MEVHIFYHYNKTCLKVRKNILVFSVNLPFERIDSIAYVS